MDEQLASPIVEILLRKLQSLCKQKVPLGREGGDKIELKRLETILSSIKVVLLDAEKLQCHYLTVRRWLKKLKEACYDAEDELEELEIEALHDRQLKMDQSTRSDAGKVCNFISCSNLSSSCFNSIDTSGRQIKMIIKRFETIEDEVRTFGFSKNVPCEIITHSSCVVDSNVVFERDIDKEDIINLLMQNDDLDVYENNIQISGPSGIGKTTLAKLVYNDERIDETFDIKMWVCLPHKYFEKKIIIDMIYSVTGRIENNMEIDQLQEILQDKLKGKKYLLVLDDYVLDLNMNRKKFKSLLSVGAKGSKIIIITNSAVTSRKTYCLGGLLDENRLSLFMKYAFKDGREKNPRLREVGVEIAKHCDFIPLIVVKILGSILYFSTDEDDWEYVKDNIKWLAIETKKKTETRTLSVLKLGYELLPSCLKQCFVYCSVFPKNHGFNNVTLTQFWMAHGLLQSDDENHEEPESIGKRYIDELRRRGFFQDFEDNFDFISFKMHPLVHDLATQMAPNDCFIMDSREAYYSSDKSYRHLSVVEAGLVQEKLFGNKMMRSILFFEMFRPSQSLIRSCISQHPNLRVLDFRNSDMEELPESIGKLKHLRYLNLTKNIRIKRLPKSIFMLTSLETLLLGGCKVLEELPEDISRLVNLRMLVFSSKQESLPENGIGHLISLRCLGIVSCYKLEKLFEDIGRLQALRTLIIGDCPKILSLPPAVKDLSSLEKLMLSDSEKNSKCNLKMEMELQSIKPHLRMLCIDGLPEFNELPQWLLQCSANSLQWLAIKNCPNFKGLPDEPRQILKSLEVLEIWNCQKFSSFSEDMHDLTYCHVQRTKVQDCPDLSKRCERDTGEDGPKINHIPKIELDGEVTKSGDYN